MVEIGRKGVFGMIELMLEFMGAHLDRKDLRAGVNYILVKMNVSPDLIGYRCLAASAEMRYTNQEQSLTKEIYPEVGRRCAPALTRGQVERNVRYAIDVAWEHRDPALWNTCFPDGEKPSNGQFISKIVEIMKLWQACNDGTEVDHREEILLHH